MAIRKALLLELDQEMSITRKTLERVPDDKFLWTPHEKSSMLGWLAGHVATLPGLTEQTIKLRLSLLVCAITTVAAWGQQPSRPEFEVAAIRPSASSDATVTAGARTDGAQVRWASYTLKRYMAIAYRVKLEQISGPDWISSDRFDISATIPAGVSTTQMPEMMQRLIEDRFQVKMHREKKDFPVYALEVAKGGLKMQVNAADPDASKADPNAPVNTNVSGSAQGVSINFGRGSSYTFADNRFEAKKLTMATLVRGLELYTDRPIVDMTDLTGTYNFTLEISAEDYQAMLVRAAVTSGLTLPPEALRLLDGASLPSLFDAMQKVGLKLDARKAPLDLLVIDEARKTPTDN